MNCPCGSRWIYERYVDYATGKPIIWQCVVCGRLLELDGSDRWKTVGRDVVILPNGLLGLGFKPDFLL